MAVDWRVTGRWWVRRQSSAPKSWASVSDGGWRSYFFSTFEHFPSTGTMVRPNTGKDSPRDSRDARICIFWIFVPLLCCPWREISTRIASSVLRRLSRHFQRSAAVLTAYLGVLRVKACHLATQYHAYLTQRPATYSAFASSAHRTGVPRVLTMRTATAYLGVLRVKACHLATQYHAYLTGVHGFVLQRISPAFLAFPQQRISAYLIDVLA